MECVIVTVCELYKCNRMVGTDAALLMLLGISIQRPSMPPFELRIYFFFVKLQVHLRQESFFSGERGRLHFVGHCWVANIIAAVNVIVT